jgi:hypothetical protein
MIKNQKNNQQSLISNLNEYAYTFYNPEVTSCLGWKMMIAKKPKPFQVVA